MDCGNWMKWLMFALPACIAVFRKRRILYQEVKKTRSRQMIALTPTACCFNCLTAKVCPCSADTICDRNHRQSRMSLMDPKCCATPLPLCFIILKTIWSGNQSRWANLPARWKKYFAKLGLTLYPAARPESGDPGIRPEPAGAGIGLGAGVVTFFRGCGTKCAFNFAIAAPVIAFSGLRGC